MSLPGNLPGNTACNRINFLHSPENLTRLELPKLLSIPPPTNMPPGDNILFFQNQSWHFIKRNFWWFRQPNWSWSWKIFWRCFSSSTIYTNYISLVVFGTEILNLLGQRMHLQIRMHLVSFISVASILASLDYGIYFRIWFADSKTRCNKIRMKE